MNPLKEATDINRLVLDLMEMGGGYHNLDDLLARLIKVLDDLQFFRLQQRGVIRMYNSRGKLVLVAQHGFRPVWLDPALDASFAAIPSHFADEAFVSELNPAEKALVLPLSYQAEPLGQAVILMAPDWTPTASDKVFMTGLAKALSGLVSRHLMHETLQLREVELDDARTQAMRQLGTASEFRDNETGLHVLRMTNFAVAIAKAMGLSVEQRELLFVTAAMHDVGKIGILDSVLLKPGKLTEEEFEIMKTHTQIGEQLLHGSGELFEAARHIALNHHENWDGTGYPSGLKGEEIPILARVSAVADVFDALVSHRAYKQAWPVDEASKWIVGQSGKKFDPVVVEGFEAALPEILRVRELYSDEVIDPNSVCYLPEPAGKESRWIRWEASLSVGIPAIDEHHRYLFELADDLIDAAANRMGTKAFSRLLKLLEQYAEVHFRAEERMMERHGHDRALVQKHQHQQFRDKLKEFTKEFHYNPLIFPSETIAYLREWLERHIRQEDIHLRSLVARHRETGTTCSGICDAFQDR